ncbi:MAG: hypothetical protein QM765_28895 [Myxococcales bacterium]
MGPHRAETLERFDQGLLLGKALGESCAAGECLTGFCKGGTCVAQPKIGEACGVIDGDGATCQVGYCSGTSSGTCTAYTKTGATCATAFECELYSWCDDAAKQCLPFCSP